MSQIQDLGLPDLVMNLFYEQAKQDGLNLDFNINKRGDIVKLTLTWKPCSINTQPCTVPNPCHHTTMKGYRKKNPSKIACNKARMEQFMKQKRQGSSEFHSGMSVKSMASSALDTTKTQNVSSDINNDQVIGVRTRQQAARARNNSIEKPRNYLNESN